MVAEKNFNPNPLIIFALLFGMFMAFTVNTFAYETCSSEILEKYEYIETTNDGRIYVYSIADDRMYYLSSDYGENILYNSEKRYFYTDGTNPISLKYFDGFNIIEGYYRKFYLDAKNIDCVYTPPVDNSGVCPNENNMQSVICWLLVFTSAILNYVVTNPLLIIILTFSIVSLVLPLFVDSKRSIR